MPSNRSEQTNAHCPVNATAIHRNPENVTLTERLTKKPGCHRWCRASLQRETGPGHPVTLSGLVGHWTVTRATHADFVGSCSRQIDAAAFDIRAKSRPGVTPAGFLMRCAR